MRVFISIEGDAEHQERLARKLNARFAPLLLEFIPDNGETEKNDNDLLLAIPKWFDAENAARIIDALPDKDRPTAVVVASSMDLDQLPREWKKALLYLQLLCGENLPGFMENIRAYPVKLIKALEKKESDKNLRNFPEIRTIVEASRAGYALIHVHTPPSDGTLPSLPHPPPTRWFAPRILAALLPIPRKRLCPRNFQKERFKELLLHPKKFIRHLLAENASPAGLAAAAAVGMFIGTLPLLGIHTISIIYVSVMLRLNKVMSVGISNLCMPPFVPVACVWIGHLVMKGSWMGMGPEAMMEALKHPRTIILDWIVGAVFLAPLNAAIFAAITYAIANHINKRVKNTQP